ncbi:MAG: hypothetical protein IJ278_01990 [Clostridia bacterium]|nr:hypothetical protein [Clostridia bacterium]
MQITDESSSNTFNKIIELFFEKEKVGINFPLNDIILTDNIFQKVKELQPTLFTEEHFNKNQLLECTGYTLLFKNNTATVLIKNDDFTKNFLWIETLVHELTHVKDFNDYLPIIKENNFYEMLHNIPFWYWTEFHARYKGYVYMLEFAQRLPEPYFQQYINDSMKRIEDFNTLFNGHEDYHLKIYYTMHLMGEILAYEYKGINIDDKSIAKENNWFDKMKEFLRKHTENVSISDMLLLSMNANKIFCKNG